MIFQFACHNYILFSKMIYHNCVILLFLRIIANYYIDCYVCHTISPSGIFRIIIEFYKHLENNLWIIEKNIGSIIPGTCYSRNEMLVHPSFVIMYFQSTLMNVMSLINWKIGWAVGKCKKYWYTIACNPWIGMMTFLLTDITQRRIQDWSTPCLKIFLVFFFKFWWHNKHILYM